MRNFLILGLALLAPLAAAQNVMTPADAVEAYDRDASRHFVSGGYTALGDYLNYSTNIRPRTSGKVQLGENDVPSVQYGQDFYLNPVTVAQYGLSHYGRFLKTNNSLDRSKFLAHADALLGMQDAEGALRYPFAYRYYATKKVMEPGWVSGMAQGQAISVWVRAYKLTGDQRYATAATQALKFMKKPVEEGGTWASLKDISPRLAELGIPDEYPNQPSTYTLNGALFAMLGLYDLSVAGPTASVRLEARQLLDNSVEAMTHLLPLYDIGGFTSYDLAHVTLKLEGPHVAPRYHAAHIYLLHALYEATGRGTLKLYETRWSSYVK